MAGLGTFRRFSFQARLVCCTSVISHSYAHTLGSRVSKIGQKRTARINLGDFFFRVSRTTPSGNEIQDMLSDKLRSIDVHVMGSARHFDEPSASPS